MGTMTTASSAAERAHEAIRAAILAGEHRPGTMLGEAPLAAGLGMSRTPVRAALVRLQDEGWITIYPKRGALVRELTPQELRDHAESRLVLEGAAVQRASAADRAALADRLAPAIEAQREALEAGDTAAYVERTLAFHRGFVEVAGNPVLLELYDRLVDRHRLVLSSEHDGILARRDRILDEHAALLQALRDDDAERFAEVLAGHVAGIYRVAPRAARGGS